MRLLAQAHGDRGDSAMHEILNQILQFLQQGIAAIFRFIHLIWTWSVDQISRLVAVPWQDWPVLKVILLVVIAALVIWALFRVFWDLWFAVERILAAFAALLVALVHTLPRVLLAGLVALGGVWIINHIDNSVLRLPDKLWAGSSSSQPENQ
jgi:hypothetical protein